MIKNFKLKHIDALMSENVNYAYLMTEFGYRKTFFRKRHNFKRAFSETYNFIESIKDFDPKNIELNPECDIKYPENIDSISFKAMMTVVSYMNNSDDLLSESMAMVIAIVCFSENCGGDFEQSGYRFDSFKKKVLNARAFDMIGLFNLLDKKLIESAEFWERRFLEVDVSDEDYLNAGGSMMNGFNVVNTIKNICSDFNYTEERAWQVPYALTQTNSLSKATQSFIQDRMRKIKEDRMKAQRRIH